MCLHFFGFPLLTQCNKYSKCLVTEHKCDAGLFDFSSTTAFFIISFFDKNV